MTPGRGLLARQRASGPAPVSCASRMPGAPSRSRSSAAATGRRSRCPSCPTCDEFEPVAVWSRTPERAQELAERARPRARHERRRRAAGPSRAWRPSTSRRRSPRTPRSRSPPPTAACTCSSTSRSRWTSPRRARCATRSSEAGVVGAVNYGRRFQATRERLLRARRRGRRRAAHGLDLARLRRPRAAGVAARSPGCRTPPLGGGRLQGYGVHDLDLLLRGVRRGRVRRRGDRGRRRASARTPTARRTTVTAEDAYVILIRFRGGGLGARQPDRHRAPQARRRHRGPRRRGHRAPRRRQVPALGPRRRGAAGRGPAEGRLQGGLRARRAQLPRRDPRRRRARAGARRRACACRRCSTRCRRADAERRWVEPEPV